MIPRATPRSPRASALLVALIAIAAWLVRAGNAVGFFSETVLVGFKSGLALYLASTQLPDLFGFKGTHGDFWERSAYFIAHLGETHQTSLLVGAVAFAALVAGKLWLKNRPVAFLVVLAGMFAARLLNLEGKGVALLGEIPQGLPSLGLPLVSRHELNALLPVALAMFVLAAVETSAIGRMFGQKHGHRFQANQELLAIGAANLFGGARPRVPGQWRHVAVARQRERRRAHAAVGPDRRGSSCSSSSLFASGLLRNLPQPVLAAIVLTAVMSLVDIHALRHIWRFSRTEFFVAMAALVGVLGSGPVNGVLLGAAISIVLLLRQAANPRVTELARIPGTTYFADRSRRQEHERTPGVFVVRCESSLFYFNVEYVRERLLALLAARPDAVRLVVFFLGAVPKIDLAGAELLSELQRTFRAKDVAFRLADAHGEVRDALRRVDFEQEYDGVLESGQSVDLVVSQWMALESQHENKRS